MPNSHSDQATNSRDSAIKKQAAIHWTIMGVLWGMLIFEIWLIHAMLLWWADPTRVSAFFLVQGRIIEIIAFALCIVMALYTIGITVMLIVNLCRKTMQHVQYRSFVRLNSLVLAAFIIHWGIFAVVAILLKSSA
ncbi:MAG: hypothetical protein WC505_02805 [Patescibacteria group bacterium]